MAYRIEQTPEFERALLGTLEYLARRDALKAGEDLIDDVDRVAGILASNPAIKAISAKPFLAARGLREFFIKNYVIVYLVSRGVVTLVGFFHQTQEYGSERYWQD